MTLPPELLRQISEIRGGRVVLVIGAGASIENPTGFETGAYYSRDAHRRLLDDGLLVQGECDDPSDLSMLADVVFAKAPGSQIELTKRLPKQPWRMATPNSGHNQAAALLIEGALRHIITLSYDLALQNALGALGAPPEVTIVRGPEDHEGAGSRSLIFLHRSVEADEEQWVLRKEMLDEAWKDSWEGIMASAGLAAPTVVFAGLGSPAAVLTDSVGRIAGASNSNFYLVDPNPESAFAEALGSSIQPVVAMLWCAFMQELSTRVAVEQIARLRVAVEVLKQERGIADSTGARLIESIAELGLVAMGKLRSSWLLRKAPYSPEGAESQTISVADLALALGHAYLLLNGESIELLDDGQVTLTDAENHRFSLHAVHAEGVKTWSAISTEIDRRMQQTPATRRTRHVLVAGMVNQPDSTPDDLVRGTDPEDLVRGADILIPIRAELIGAEAKFDIEGLRKVLAQ